MAEWMDAWVSYRLATGTQAVDLPNGPHSAVYLHGSIGYDSAITSRGEVWKDEYDFDGPNAFKERWQPAAIKDAIRFLVIAVRNHPELAVLLPSRTPSADGCQACNGSGDRHVQTADGDVKVPLRGLTCEVCSGLGWVPDNLSLQLPMP